MAQETKTPLDIVGDIITLLNELDEDKTKEQSEVLIKEMKENEIPESSPIYQLAYVAVESMELAVKLKKDVASLVEKRVLGITKS